MDSDQISDFEKAVQGAVSGASLDSNQILDFDSAVSDVVQKQCNVDFPYRTISC